jgi:undecaprenyl-diphosphatase
VVEGTKLVFARKVPPTADGKLAWLFVLATLPAAAVGALFEDQIDNRLGTPTIIGVSLIGFGILLAIADRSVGRRKVDGFRAKDALLVGAAQALALNPGTSRSGITMTAGRFLGFDRDAAVRISFVMSIPVIFGAVVFKLGGLIVDGVPDGLLVPMIVGIVTSGCRAGWRCGARCASCAPAASCRSWCIGSRSVSSSWWSSPPACAERPPAPLGLAGHVGHGR